MAPQMPVIKGRGGTPVYLDLIGQMDTAFRWMLSPADALAARWNVIPRAFLNQFKGQTFFGEPLTDEDPRVEAAKRGIQAVTDVAAPIGATQALGVAREQIPGAERFIAEGESRLGGMGQALQAGFGARRQQQAIESERQQREIQKQQADRQASEAARARAFDEALKHAPQDQLPRILPKIDPERAQQWQMNQYKIQGAQAEQTERANAARPADSVPPAMLAATIQPSVIALPPRERRGPIIRAAPHVPDRSREPDQRCHAPGYAVAAKGEEALRLRMRAPAPAGHAAHATGLQSLTCHRVEVEQPVPGALRRERHRRLLVVKQKRLADFIADFIGARPDRRPEPGLDPVRPRTHRCDGRFDHPGVRPDVRFAAERWARH